MQSSALTAVCMELFGRRKERAKSNLGVSCPGTSSPCYCACCVLQRVVADVMSNPPSHPYAGNNGYLQSDLDSASCRAVKREATGPFYRLHRPDFPKLNPLRDRHAPRTFERYSNRIIPKLTSWQPLSTYYSGSLEFSFAPFWTTSSDLQVVGDSPTPENVIETRLRLGLSTAFHESVLLQWQPSGKVDTAFVPTEIEGFSHPFFLPIQLNDSVASGMTVDLTTMPNLKLGVPEFIIAKIPVEELNFVQIRFDESAFQSVLASCGPGGPYAIDHPSAIEQIHHSFDNLLAQSVS